MSEVVNSDARPRPTTKDLHKDAIRLSRAGDTRGAMSALSKAKKAQRKRSVTKVPGRAHAAISHRNRGGVLTMVINRLSVLVSGSGEGFSPILTT